MEAVHGDDVEANKEEEGQQRLKKDRNRGHTFGKNGETLCSGDHAAMPDATITLDMTVLQTIRKVDVGLHTKVHVEKVCLTGMRKR